MSQALLEELRARFPRVAVVHEWLTIPGGSEQVVLELLDMFPQAELFASIYNPEPWPAQIKERRVHASYLTRMPGARSHYQRLLPLMDRAYRAFDLGGFDLVLSSNHAFAKNVRVPPGVPHVCYCHTPMRYAWQEDFLAGEAMGRPARLALPLLLGRLRRQDLRGAASPDVFVANSRHVAQRIERCYGRGAEVVHPPVDVEHFLALPRAPRDFYLVFGRVVPYKRVDLALAACARLGLALKVAGGGRALAALRASVPAGADVEFLGRIDDAARDRLLSGARALLFPGEEDFGIVPVEAQAAGVPVIAYGVGGGGETVLDGRTGVLFGEQTVDGLAGAIERLRDLELDEAEVRANAGRFSRERFRAEMAAVIAAASAEAGGTGNGVAEASRGRLAAAEGNGVATVAAVAQAGSSAQTAGVDLERARREREAYDEHGVEEAMSSWHGRFPLVFECPNTRRGEARFDALTRAAVSGRRVLDMGCGDGASSVRLLELGAGHVLGMDISRSAIAQARARAQGEAQADRLEFRVGDVASDLKGQVDCIFGRSILHHVDYRGLLPRLYAERLTPGGTMLFMEPQGENLLIRGYTRLVAAAHTPDERSFVTDDLEWLRAHFPGCELYPINYLSFPAALAGSLLGLGPNNPLLRACDRADEWLARRASRLRSHFRQTIVVIRKPPA
ncbi:MAG TPA: glycosyltransferase [Solirubrobacteraceae bacterium]|nr:glycosyltransferase [Solirubrobacteraceae bacterium]